MKDQTCKQITMENIQSTSRVTAEIGQGCLEIAKARAVMRVPQYVISSVMGSFLLLEIINASDLRYRWVCV